MAEKQEAQIIRQFREAGVTYRVVLSGESVICERLGHHDAMGAPAWVRVQKMADLNRVLRSTLVELVNEGAAAP